VAGFPAVDGSGGFAHTLWNSLSEEGVWGIPRTGLIFVRRAGRLLLIEQMPHEAGMPFSAEALRDAQAEEFIGVRDMFRAIGVDVLRDEE
jgi:hypothetical protein